MGFYHKYCWNMLYSYQIESFKLRIGDIYAQKTGDKALGEQIFELFEDLVTNAGK